MSIEFLRKIRETEQEAENCVVNAREKAQKQQADASEQAMKIVKDAEDEAKKQTAVIMTNVTETIARDSDAMQEKSKEEIHQIEQEAIRKLDEAAEQVKEYIITRL